MAQVLALSYASDSFFSHATSGDGNCCRVFPGTDCTLTANQISWNGVRIYQIIQAVPPSLPPALPGAASGISGDPHLKGAHGDEADIKGEHRAVYNALSARNMSLNMLVEHDDFRTPFSRINVHGSWVRAAFQTVRTARTGRLLQVFFHAIDPHRAIITEGCTAPYCRTTGGTRHVLIDGGAPFVAENLKVSLQRKTLSLSNGQWRTTCESTVGAPHAGKLRMNIEIKPLYAVDYDAVAPHGLLGQSYDRDQLEVNGRRDDYSKLDDGRPTSSRTGAGGHLTTKAQAEGAIEGVLSDYRVKSDFATGFKFSRFDAVFARVRNATALAGQVGARHVFSHPGREVG